jgi:amidase
MSSSDPSAPDWHYQELTQIARLVHGGEISPVELTQAMLDRIALVDANLGAYITPTAELALAQAHQAQEEIARGTIRGPLHGVPIAVKDIYDTAGINTTAGMAIHRDRRPDSDATVITRLREAGAILLGKLTLTEGVYGEHRPPFPAPINPWHADYWSGASSTGSGVAVAAGLCFAALGSETGGSIRLPSAVNGVTGLKPTWGRVSRHGVFELAATLDHVGPLARSAADAAAMLGIIAGPDTLDPTAAQVAVPDYAAALDAGVDGLRIGVDHDWVSGNTDAETLAALNESLDVLQRCGATLIEVSVPDVTQMIWDWFPICAVQTARAHAATYPARKDEYGPALAALLETGNALSGIEYQEALLRRMDFSGRVQALLQTVDVLALPVLSFPAPTISRMQDITDEIIAGIHRFTCPFNLSANPGIVLPNGFSAAGVPIVFQLIGRHFEEALLLTAGHAFQQATTWHQRHPAH